MLNYATDSVGTKAQRLCDLRLTEKGQAKDQVVVRAILLNVFDLLFGEYLRISCFLYATDPCHPLRGTFAEYLDKIGVMKLEQHVPDRSL